MPSSVKGVTMIFRRDEGDFERRRTANQARALPARSGSARGNCGKEVAEELGADGVGELDRVDGHGAALGGSGRATARQVQGRLLAVFRELPFI
jgi:hypothetical protein